MSAAAAADLLPSNATVLERELALQSGTLDAIDPVAIEGIWDAWRCPAALLPWLAWALSVDHWDDAWSEIIKRQTIADSPAYHRRKGSVASVEDLVALAGKPFSIIEWWQHLSLSRRGTAIIHIEAALDEVNGVLRKVRPLVMASKPKSRAVFLGAGEAAVAVMHMGAGLLEESLTIVNPYTYLGDAADGFAVMGAGLLDETLTTIGPAA
jgi:phage tail P2-like protein